MVLTRTALWLCDCGTLVCILSDLNEKEWNYSNWN
jgi:hypothetical protein